jgi:1-phosphofructokinase family hexose kinase
MDVEWRVEQVRWEEKNSILSERRWPGGKGVNVARWIRHLGGKSKLLLPIGGENGHELIRGLQAGHLPSHVVRLREQTRANVIVTTMDVRQLRFNPAGPRVSHREWQRIIEATGEQVQSARLAIFSGSLPAGVPDRAYRELIAKARTAGVSSLLDCDGKAFAQGIRARPFLVKPNVHELENWFGKPLRAKREIHKAATALSKLTRNWVLVSRGRDGALLLNSLLGKSFEAQVPPGPIVNTVGAGDAMLAGAAYAINSGLPPESWLHWGLACGSAAVRHPAGVLPARKLIERIVRGFALQHA